MTRSASKTYREHVASVPNGRGKQRGNDMKGEILTIRANGEEERVHLTSPANISEQLRDAVGGYLETVPHYDRHLDIDGRSRPCVAYCNEQGKLQQLQINLEMTVKWLVHCGLSLENPPDVLVGDIAIVMGDEEFLRGL